MASTLIHYAISNRILEKIHVKDKFLFLMGASVGPDASSHDDGSYNIAHFGERTENKKGINWLVFANEYQTNILSNDFLIGYYCHLIQDAVWFHDIVDKYVRCFKGDERKALYQMGYRDYVRLNYLLTKKYEINSFEFRDFEIPVKEITKEKMNISIDNFKIWFAANSCEENDLELYHWDVIEEYIEKCISICVLELDLLFEKKKGLEPESLYVHI